MGAALKKRWRILRDAVKEQVPYRPGLVRASLPALRIRVWQKTCPNVRADDPAG